MDALLQLTMVQATGVVSLGNGIEEGEALLLALQKQHEGVLWQPGKLGTVVVDPSKSGIGSCHLRTSFEDTNVSLLVFRTGKYKISVGRGLPQVGTSMEPIESFIRRAMYKYVAQEPTTINLGLLTGFKRYPPLDPRKFAEFLEQTGKFPVVRKPHYTQAGRINALRAYFCVKQRENIAVDHTGTVHFTGFRSVVRLREAEELTEMCIKDFGRLMSLQKN